MVRSVAVLLSAKGAIGASPPFVPGALGHPAMPGDLLGCQEESSEWSLCSVGNVS